MIFLKRWMASRNQAVFHIHNSTVCNYAYVTGKFIYNIVHHTEWCFNLRSSKNRQRCFSNFRKTWMSLRFKNIIPPCIKTVSTCKYFQRVFNLVIKDLCSKISVVEVKVNLKYFFNFKREEYILEFHMQ